MAWQNQQSVGNTGAGVTSLSVTFGSTVTAGRKYVVATATGTGTVTSVQNGAGTSLTQLATQTSPGNCQLYLHALDIPAGDGGTAPTITVNLSGSTFPSMIAQEVSGLAPGNTSAMLDGAAGGSSGALGASPGSTTSPSYTSHAQNEYLVALYGDDGQNLIQACSGYTLDAHSQQSPNCDCDIFYKNSTGGAETATITNAQGNWAELLVAFSLPSPSGGPFLPWQYTPAAQPARRFQPWPVGWAESPPPSSAPASGPPVYPLQAPVRAQGTRGLPRRGRTAGNAGVFSQTGPPVTPLRGPARARQPLPPRGRAQGRAGTFTPAVASGPPVYPLDGPVRAALPLQPLRKGRTATMVALPLFYAGPPLTPLRGPVKAAQPLPPRGRAQGRAGTWTFVATGAGPPVYPLHGPVQGQVRGLPRRGRCAGNAGTRQQTGPPVTPLQRPVCARQPLPRRGRCAGSQGTFTQVSIQSGPPVYPLRGPVRTRPQPPPRGRCAGNRGIRHQTGPPVTPLRGPVAPFRPGPYRSGRCSGNPGAFAQTGPRVYALRGPVRSRVPARARGGQVGSDMGAPVFVPPFTIGALTASDASLAVLSASDAAGGSGAVLTASDTRLGGPG